MSTERLAFENGNAVPTTPPAIYFDEDGERIDPDQEAFPRFVRDYLPTFVAFLCDWIESGPDKSCAVRSVALRRAIGLDSRTLEEAADGRNFSRSALAEAEKTIRKKLNFGKIT